MNKASTLIVAVLILSSHFVSSQNSLEKKYDVKQYILDLQSSNTSTSISGNVIINARVSSAILDTFALDLIDTAHVGQCFMVVDSVFFNGIANTFQHQNNLVKLPLGNPLMTGEFFSAQIFYHGKAAPVSEIGYNGIYLATYYGKAIATSSSEPDGSRVWWPCKQDLTDKADSVTFYITTDASNKSGSNGLLKSVDTLPGGTKVRYKWMTKHAIDYYLISFAVGPYTDVRTFAPVHNGQDSVLLQSMLISNSSAFPFHLLVIEKAKKLMALYTKLLCDYPFQDEKYGYSISDGGIGAMENQTMTTIGALAMDTTANNWGGYNYWYTAHELAHQWFGDYITCADWNDIWLNEGFASYMEYIALQNMESQSSADKWMLDAHTETLTQPGGSVYASWDYRLMYKKSASIIHILRHEIDNDSLFFAVLKNYLNAFKDSVASTGDFKHIAELTTGLDLTDFFTQWYYGEGYPIFELQWEQQNDTLFLTSGQTTSTSVTNLFRIHFDLKIFSTTGDTIIRLFQESNNEVYKLYYPRMVDSVQFDPQNWLIEKNSIHTGIRENTVSRFFTIFPNPSKGKIILTINQPLSSKNIKFSMFSIHGQLVFHQQIKKEQTEIDISQFAKGIYLIKLSGEKKTEVLKFVKE